MFQKLLIAATVILVSFNAHADDGRTWNKSTQSSKREEMVRILGNIKAKGCVVRRSPEYYVRQMDAFYADRSTVSIKIGHALGLIATAAGEDWDC